MREFLVESVLPLAAVSAFTAVVTVALFDVPAAPPPAPTRTLTRLEKGDALDQVIQKLNAGRRDRPIAYAPRPRPVAPEGSAAAGPEASSIAVGTVGGVMPLPDQPPEAPEAAGQETVAQETLTAATSLAAAVKSVRSARTEEDLVAAEAQLRGLRLQMSNACAAHGGPLCESASSIESLGY